MEIQSVMVTGANRGIGLEFVKQFVLQPSPPKYVFATYRSRDSVKVLKDLRDKTKNTQIILIKADVTNATEVEAASKIVEDMVGEDGLNILVNNAGIFIPLNFPTISGEDLLKIYKTNTAGPIMVLQAMLSSLQKAADRNSNKSGLTVTRAAVLNISSLAGSVANSFENSSLLLGAIGYKMSKAALNISMRTIAASLTDKGVLVVNMCPGWVKTDMGGEMALLELPDSVSQILKTLAIFNESHHGGYFDRFGEPINF